MACRSKTVAYALSLLLAAAAALSGPAIAASQPSAAPTLRVETGTHTSMIRRIAVDAARNRVVTCGDDKTIRIWQMPEQRLVRTLRVPIDVGHEGQLFGLAISPDGRRIAVGGWTGWDWNGSASVYLFDADSGELTQRIGGLPDAIHALAWSPDGEHIAIGLQGRAGLRVVRAADGEQVASDLQYRDKLTDLAFAGNGRLAAASLDGMVRLYNADFRLIGRRVVPGGKTPVGLRFSPDAAHIAVAFADAPAVAVVSARDLELAFAPVGANAPGQHNILTVGWSHDGRHLYAAGDYRGSGSTPVYRWNEGGRGAVKRIAAARNRVVDIQTMAGGRMAFAAEDPGFGVIDGSGALRAFKRPDILDFSDAHGRLLVSDDGATVSYPFDEAKGRTASFAVRARPEDNPVAGKPGQTVFPPALRSAGLRIEDWRNGAKPLINGHRPAFDDYEIVRSYAIGPEGNRVLLGTEWALRLVDEQAREIWSVKLAAVARAVNISRNAHLAVAALSDGSIRWYAMRDGREVFAYFPHRNGKDWIAWVPSGYYASSHFGDNFVGWHVNRGQDTLPDFFRAVQFDRILYRPDLVTASFEEAASGNTLSSVGGTKLALFDITRLGEIAPPRLRVTTEGVTTRNGEAVLKLALRGEMGGAPTHDFAVYLNGIPLTPAGERRLTSAEGKRFERSVQVPLSSHRNQVRVEAFNGLSMGVDETYVSVPENTPLSRRRGDLYLLAIGANEFPDLPAETHLAFAAQDAEAISAALEQRGSGVYRNIYTKVISDNSGDKPRRDTIERSLSFLDRARGNDTVVVFLASHGISDLQGNYYFVPRDAAADDIDRLFTGGEIRSLVPWTTFFNGLRMVAGRRLLIVDTCQASKIQGRFESHALLKRSAASLFSLMLASKGGELSQEHASTGHGLFTYSLLSAMSSGSDADRDGLLSQEELFAAAELIVERNRDVRTGPQTPQLVAPKPLGGTPLVMSRK